MTIDMSSKNLTIFSTLLNYNSNMIYYIGAMCNWAQLQIKNSPKLLRS